VATVKPAAKPAGKPESAAVLGRRPVKASPIVRQPLKAAAKPEPAKPAAVNPSPDDKTPAPATEKSFVDSVLGVFGW